MTRAEAIKKGKKTYSSGTPCHAGHTAKRYVTSRRCVKCDTISSKQKSKKQKLNFAENLRLLTKKSIKDISKMDETQLDLHLIKIHLTLYASLGFSRMKYEQSQLIDILLEKEGLKVEGNKIIW